MSAPAAERRCRPRPQPRAAGDLRPTDVVGAFFICGLAFLLAAAAAGVLQWVAPWSWGRWLALHLAFVGGVSALVLGASQFFAGAFLATDPPSRGLVRAQLASWNAGAILLAVAIPAGWGALVWAAVGLLLTGLAVWAGAVTGMRRGSLRRSPWATRWYASGCLFLGFGVIAGSLLAHGTLWTHGSLLDAHMSLNLAGWFGGAIVGTLHTFYPSLTGTQLRFPRLQGAAFATWTAGVAALAVGYAWSLDALACAGWLALAAGAALLLANVLACLARAPRPLSLPARIVGVAQPFLLAGTALAATLAIDQGAARALSGAWRDAVGTLLVAGWIGLTVLGSLLHLLAVVLRVRGGFHARMPAALPWLDLPLAALAALGTAALAVSQAAGFDGPDRVATVALLIAYAALAAQIASRAAGVLRRARPGI